MVIAASECLSVRSSSLAILSAQSGRWIVYSKPRNPSSLVMAALHFASSRPAPKASVRGRPESCCQTYAGSLLMVIDMRRTSSLRSTDRCNDRGLSAHADYTTVIG